MAESKNKSKRVKKVLYYVLLCFFIAVFLGSILYLGNYLLSSQKASGVYKDLSDLRNQVLQDQGSSGNQNGTSGSQGGSSGTEGGSSGTTGILPEYQAIYDLNNDLVGWITVPGTKVDYPVVQSSPENDNYYLYRNFYRENDKWGCIYVRETCDVFTPSDNVTIYGHRMNDGSMFAGLLSYKTKSFWEEHPTFTFDTIYEHHTYEIVAVFKTSANVGQGFSYHTFETASNEAEFNEYISTVKSLQLYDTGVDAEYGDMLVTLSTCTPRNESPSNGRFVIVAKRIS